MRVRAFFALILCLLISTYFEPLMESLFLLTQDSFVALRDTNPPIENDIFIRKYPPKVKILPSQPIIHPVPEEGSYTVEEVTSSVIYRGNTDEKLVCLTFDDGPDNLITPKIISILDSYGIKGSFFCVGNKLKKSSEIVKKASENGHLILNHSWSHPDLARLSGTEVNNQIIWTENQIFSITGKRPAIIRTPYGTINNTIKKAAAGNKYKIVLWSIDTRDWTGNTTEDIVNRVLSGIKPGSIILMHSYQTRQFTLDALPHIISKLTEMGYKFIDIGQMLNINPYKD